MLKTNQRSVNRSLGLRLQLLLTHCITLNKSALLSDHQSLFGMQLISEDPSENIELWDPKMSCVLNTNT